MSAAAAAGRDRRALCWELGPHRGLRQMNDADSGKVGGGRRPRGGDQEAARGGLMLDPTGTRAEAAARRPSPGGLGQGWRDHARHLRSGRPRSGGRLPSSRLRAPLPGLCAPAEGRPRQLLCGGKGKEAGGNSGKLGVGDGAGCG